MAEPAERPNGDAGRIVFFVNNQPIKAEPRRLAIWQILQMSGHCPPGDFYLLEHQPQGKPEKHTDLAKVITVRESQRFQAVRRATTFFVDAEELNTPTGHLTVSNILEMSGNVPPQNFYLVKCKGRNHQEKHDNLAEKLKVHEQDRFVAVYRGPTPVSQS